MTHSLKTALVSAKLDNKVIPIAELTAQGLINHDLIMQLEDKGMALTYYVKGTRSIVLTLKGYKQLKGGIA